MPKEINKKNLQDFIETRIEDLTSPVGFQYGYIDREESVARLRELQILSGTFDLDREEQVRAAIRPLDAYLKEKRGY